jgi:hypothetical protein
MALIRRGRGRGSFQCRTPVHHLVLRPDAQQVVVRDCALDDIERRCARIRGAQGPAGACGRMHVRFVQRHKATRCVYLRRSFKRECEA